MRRKKLVALVTAAAAVVALGTVGVVRLLADDPVDVVRAYLEAARRGDVAGALKAAGADAPTGDAGTLLAGTTRHDPLWQVASVGPFSEYKDEAQVNAVITDQVNSGEGYFDLAKHGGRWTITNPYVTLAVAASPVRITVIDGRQVTLTAAQQVLPGIYRQTGPVPSAVRIDNDVHLVAMPAYSSDRTFTLPQAFAPTAEAQQNFQRMSDAYFDTCLTGTACAPKNVSSYYRTDKGDVYLDTEVTKTTWHVVRYPAVDLSGAAVAASDGQAFAGQVTVPGVLGVDGVSTHGSFSMVCEYDGSGYGLQAWIDASGTMRVAWSGLSKHPEADCRAPR